MNVKCTKIIKIATPVITFINIVFLILFFVTAINRCQYSDIMSEIKDKVKDDKETISHYANIFCDTNSASGIFTALGLGLLYILDVCFIITLASSFISLLVFVFKKNKCGLISSLSGNSSCIFIGIINLAVAFSKLEELYSSGYSGSLPNGIWDAYESVKAQKLRMQIYSSFSLFFTILCSIFIFILLKRLKREENEALMENYNQMRANINNNAYSYNVQQYNWNIQNTQIIPNTQNAQVIQNTQILPNTQNTQVIQNTQNIPNIQNTPNMQYIQSPNGQNTYSGNV